MAYDTISPAAPAQANGAQSNSAAGTNQQPATTVVANTHPQSQVVGKGHATPILKTNEEMLNEEAIKMGYTGPAMNAEDALIWIVDTQNGLTPNTPLSVSQQVAQNKSNIDSLLKNSRFLGTYVDSSEADAANPNANEGDFALFDKLLYIRANGRWVEPVKKVVELGQSFQLPTGLGINNEGQIFFDKDTRTLFVWDGRSWIMEQKLPVIDGYVLRIV